MYSNQKAQDRNVALNANYMLGRAYFYGVNGKAQNGEMAMECFLIGAGAGHMLSEYAIGVCYQYGVGVKRKAKKALYWYRRAAKKGCAEAQVHLGDHYFKKKNYKKAVQWYSLAADKGYARATARLAKCYTSGKGVKADAETAQRLYYLMSVRYPGEQYVLSGAYNKVTGEWRDPETNGYLTRMRAGVCREDWEVPVGANEETVDDYKRAAENGNAQAQYKLGCCYYHGIVVENDYAEALKWLKAAMDSGRCKAYKKAKAMCKVCKLKLKWAEIA